jgi:hypothetical protein
MPPAIIDATGSGSDIDHARQSTRTGHVAHSDFAAATRIVDVRDGRPRLGIAISSPRP